jgi:hypothetical protein
MNVEKHSKRVMSPEMRARLAKLPKIEQKYFRMAWPKSGVLYVQDRPGSGKTAILQAMTENMGFRYEDFRLSSSDETDFKYPFLKERDVNGQTITVSGYAVPEWAVLANSTPTVIVFEELNRAPLYVRNAALQILLERRIGQFKFNDDVLMVATGNLGEEDDTDVEELDAALMGRLIPVRHELLSKEWLQNFATENIHPSVCKFIELYPQYMYQDSVNGGSYASPRTWTFLSDYIVCNYGPTAAIKDFMEFLQESSVSYIGEAAASKFIKFCTEQLRVTVDDILNDWPRAKRELAKFNRDKRSELLQDLNNVDINALNKNQLDNLIEFVKLVADDEATGFLMTMISKYENIHTGNVLTVTQTFHHLVEQVFDTQNREII